MARGTALHLLENGTLATTVIGGAILKQSETSWVSGDEQLAYTETGNDLVLTLNDGAGGTVTLKDFQDGNFGIRLSNFVQDPSGDNLVKGDLQPVDFKPPNQEYHFDEPGNVIVDPNTPMCTSSTYRSAAAGA
jgi:hypothetical protein